MLVFVYVCIRGGHSSAGNNEKIREKSGKFMKNSVRKNLIVFANVLENFDSDHFISIFCQRIRVISVTFCYTADNLELGENILSRGKFSESQGKWKLINNGHPGIHVYTCMCKYIYLYLEMCTLQ